MLMRPSMPQPEKYRTKFFTTSGFEYAVDMPMLKSSPNEHRRKFSPVVDVRRLMSRTYGSTRASTVMRPRFESVVVVSRAVKRLASSRRASFTNRGARRRSGFFSSAIMRFMRGLRLSGSVATRSCSCTFAAIRSTGSSSSPGT